MDILSSGITSRLLFSGLASPDLTRRCSPRLWHALL